MNDIRWMHGEHRGGVAQPQKQHIRLSVSALYHSSGLQTLAWSKLLVLTGKKCIAFKLSAYLRVYKYHIALNFHGSL